MIRVAIVGTGGISHAHIKGYLQFPERCKIVALVDIVPEKAQRVKEQYQLDADVYDDHQKILPRFLLSSLTESGIIILTL